MAGARVGLESIYRLEDLMEKDRTAGSSLSTVSCQDDAERLRGALDQACTNLALCRPDRTRDDQTIGYQARLWRACLLAGWGGPLGFPFDDEAVSS